MGIVLGKGAGGKCEGVWGGWNLVHCWRSGAGDMGYGIRLTECGEGGGGTEPVGPGFGVEFTV